MGIINDITQKIKGKIEQGDGKIKQESGKPVEGTIEKIKGKIDDTIGSGKLRNDTNK